VRGSERRVGMDAITKAYIDERFGRSRATSSR